MSGYREPYLSLATKLAEAYDLPAVTSLQKPTQLAKLRATLDPAG